jgi:hypothetical protein
MWDVRWFDEDTMTAYRVAVKRMTVGDGVAIGMLEDELAQREDLTGRLFLRLFQDYPLLRYGTRRAEQAVLSEVPAQDEAGDPILPDEADWQELELTETTFMALPEWLFWLWLTAIIRKNPQYDRSYAALKKSALTERPAQKSDSAMSESAPDGPPSARTPSSA